jgi:hypothetical protein
MFSEPPGVALRFSFEIGLAQGTTVKVNPLCVRLVDNEPHRSTGNSISRMQDLEQWDAIAPLLTGDQTFRQLSYAGLCFGRMANHAVTLCPGGDFRASCCGRVVFILLRH